MTLRDLISAGLRQIGTAGAVCAIISSTVLLASLFSYTVSAIDPLNLFKVPLLWFGAGASIILAASMPWRRNRRWAITIIATFIAIGLGIAAVPTISALPDCHGDQLTSRLRIVSANLWSENRDPAAALAWVRAQQPDVAVLVEARDNASTIVDALADELPYRVSCHRHVRCSTLILSRIKPVTVMPLAAGDAENRRAVSAAVMTLPLGSSLIDVVAVHLSRPWPSGQQRRELDRITQYVATHPDRRLVVAGDFNSTPSTLLLQNFALENGLNRIAIAAGTWPVWRSSTAPALLAIDHIFAGNTIGAQDTTASGAIGSDHRGLAATLCVAPSRTNAG